VFVVVRSDLKAEAAQHSAEPTVLSAQRRVVSGRQRQATSLAAAAQQLGERVAEIARAQAVDERVRRRVDVAEPEEHGEQSARRVAGRTDGAAEDTLLRARTHGVALRIGRGRTDGAEQVDGEERRPADDEAADDDADRLGGLRLAVERPQLGRDSLTPTELTFCVPLDVKKVILQTFFPLNRI